MFLLVSSGLISYGINKGCGLIRFELMNIMMLLLVVVSECYNVLFLLGCIGILGNVCLWLIIWVLEVMVWILVLLVELEFSMINLLIRLLISGEMLLIIDLMVVFLLRVGSIIEIVCLVFVVFNFLIV